MERNREERRKNVDVVVIKLIRERKIDSEGEKINLAQWIRVRGNEDERERRKKKEEKRRKEEKRKKDFVDRT